MARYEHLPIYRAAMDLAVFIEKDVFKMSRYNKYTLRTEMRKRSIAIISFVVIANSSVHKVPVLEELRCLIYLFKENLLLVQLGHFYEFYGY